MVRDLSFSPDTKTCKHRGDGSVRFVAKNGMMNTNRNHFVCGLRLVFMIFEPLLCLAQVTKAKELPQWQERAPRVPDLVDWNPIMLMV